MRENFDLHLLRKMVAYHLPVKEENLVFEPVPTGKFNTTYFVRDTDKEMVLRIAPRDDAGFIFYERGMMAQEPPLHAIVRERTSVPVPEIFAYDDSRKLINRDYLIMERLPGKPMTELTTMPIDIRNHVLFQIGFFLRQIHEITTDKYGYIGPHHPMEPQNSWAEAFRIMWDKMIDDVSATGHYSPEDADFMRNLLTSNYSCFDRPVISRLLHMDVWEQNILVMPDGTVSGILDMDRALWGDVEIEFAVLDYVGFSQDAFWAGYGAERDTSEAAYVRQHLYLLYEIQKYIVIHHWRHNDPMDAARRKRQAIALAHQLK
ncbi:MAG TPA: aminoglycoside phosphotransferase family protein [Armatimonadota bacterium]|nr:aminoglycoside phosphotransferase family protein [Armatimonadota bacterium]